MQKCQLPPFNLFDLLEELKATDQMKWVGLMNNVRGSAEEIVLKELIYV